jgi:hypothetical protein
MPLDQSLTPTRAALLHDARDLLRRAEACDRWGMVAMDYAWRASELLRAAGLTELADSCADEWLFDAGAVLAEVERGMRG